MQKITTQEGDTIREFFKQWPQFYFFIVYLFGPAYLGYMGPLHFLRKYFPVPNDQVKIANLGSGPRVVRADLINVDITSYETVHVTAPLEALPFEDESIDAFVCDNVLEHVSDPVRVREEMHRILKVGGVGYISTPFLYPFHSSPSDHFRWTDEGLKKLFSGFLILEIGTRSGIFSALNVWLCYLIPSVFSFGSDKLYWILVNVSLFLFFPIKFFDIVANKLPFANRTASVLYMVVKKV